jgi:hypothetical protein
MSHFSPSEWIDFTLGLLSQQQTAVLQSHLDNNCEECLKSRIMWRSVSEFLSQEARYTPPDHVITCVKQAYAIHKPWKWLVEAAQRAQLVFDSFTQPTPAFVRSSTSASRRVMHEAPPFVIDLRLEMVGDRLFLLGQILNSDNPDQELVGVDILLLEDEDLVASAKANSSGEFELQCARDRDLRLFINIREYRAIAITLPDEEF